MCSESRLAQGVIARCCQPNRVLAQDVNAPSGAWLLEGARLVKLVVPFNELA